MIKGCQKKIVVIKDPASEIYEEAYFILREDAEECDETDILKEANRIVASSKLASSDGRSKSRPSAAEILKSFKWFVAGLAAGGLIGLAVIILM